MTPTYAIRILSSNIAHDGAAAPPTFREQGLGFFKSFDRTPPAYQDTPGFSNPLDKPLTTEAVDLGRARSAAVKGHGKVAKGLNKHPVQTKPSSQPLGDPSLVCCPTRICSTSCPDSHLEHAHLH